ncbi:hypothetical protein [uncultured Dysgonomonas sp.]|uniref:hypothetical protein n=1 Tax=uncultured Dysgonomonas sp. TaxID=206096 RepID=UPI00262FF436|nr:hypothetical protein [uncultured Dysgonomonas sp.]
MLSKELGDLESNGVVTKMVYDHTCYSRIRALQNRDGCSEQNILDVMNSYSCFTKCCKSGSFLIRSNSFSIICVLSSFTLL